MLSVFIFLYLFFFLSEFSILNFSNYVSPGQGILRPPSKNLRCPLRPQTSHLDINTAKSVDLAMLGLAHLVLGLISLHQCSGQYQWGARGGDVDTKDGYDGNEGKNNDPP